jgi:hypothetical protein
MDPDPDADPDPSIFKTNKKSIFFFLKVSCILLFEGGTITSFSKIKSQKEVTKQ